MWTTTVPSGERERVQARVVDDAEVEADLVRVHPGRHEAFSDPADVLDELRVIRLLDGILQLPDVAGDERHVLGLVLVEPARADLDLLQLDAPVVEEHPFAFHAHARTECRPGLPVGPVELAALDVDRPLRDGLDEALDVDVVVALVLDLDLLREEPVGAPVAFDLDLPPDVQVGGGDALVLLSLDLGVRAEAHAHALDDEAVRPADVPYIALELRRVRARGEREDDPDGDQSPLHTFDATKARAPCQIGAARARTIHESVALDGRSCPLTASLLPAGPRRIPIRLGSSVVVPCQRTRSPRRVVRGGVTFVNARAAHHIPPSFRSGRDRS